MANSLERAQYLLAQGRREEAVAMVHRASVEGSSEACMQLAVWHVAGQVLARDMDKAADFLRRAVEIGHVDAALMEAALIANGFGGSRSPHWASAVNLLRKAATSDPVAAQHQALLDRMHLLADGNPAAVDEPSTLSASPKVQYFPALLSRDECSHLASVASVLLEPSFVIDPKSGKATPHPVRLSDHGTIGPAREDVVIRAINLRIAAATGTSVANGEPLTVLRYKPGHQYRPHLDTIASATNQRVRTVLIYLNGGFEGGETHFPELDLMICPKGGGAVMFDTTYSNGTPDTRAIHAGLPVRTGVKWLATRWIRAAPIDPWTIVSA